MDPSIIRDLRGGCVAEMGGIRVAKQVGIVFSRAEGYRCIAANIAWGAVTPYGDIKFDLAIESTQAPEMVTRDIAEDGSVGPETRHPDTPRLVREVQIGVLVTPDFAERLAKWLTEKVAQARSAATGAKADV